MLAKALSAATAAGPAKLYVEDVFSTWLYTGNGSTQTITNGIDLSGEGGLVWTKPRVNATQNDHIWVDSERGNFQIQSSTTAANNGIASFNFSVTGYTVPSNLRVNESGITYTSWTFRKAEKFFDVVSYTGNGSNRTIAHNLGSVPGCIIVKRTDTTGDWQVYHRSLANTEYLVLNSTAAKATGTTRWNSTTPTSTVFSLGTDATVNASGGTYVAYLFAHDAGGFGDSGNDSVIKCGSFTTNSSAEATVNLGWEPQWILFKRTDSGTSGEWYMLDTMRGWCTGTSSGSNDERHLWANSADAESTPSGYGDVLPTGFLANGVASNATFIYIAIRRGPMKTPTDATKVFSASTASTGNNTPGFVTDNLWTFYRDGTSSNTEVRSRLLGNTPYLVTSSGAAQASGSDYKWDTNNGVNYTWGSPYIGYYFRRAPGFFDVVAYTGTGSALTLSHNLGVTPELVIIKNRTTATFPGWVVTKDITATTQTLYLNTDEALTNRGQLVGPGTSTTLDISGAGRVNASAVTYIAYLFASCPGVSKVGNYTGTGTTQQINCGFTAGARFVLIKRTDSTGSWYIWDSARGIISGNDPYLLLNSTAAEVTNTDYIDPYSPGFEISSTAPAEINANGGSYIFLAVA